MSVNEKLLEVAQSEVDDFDVGFTGHENVFGFDVSVANSCVVDVLKSFDNLLENVFRCIFSETLFIDDFAEERSLCTEFEDDVVIERVFEDVKKLTDTWVFESLEDSDLTLEAVFDSTTEKAFLRDYFACELFTGFTVDCNFDY